MLSFMFHKYDPISLLFDVPIHGTLTGDEHHLDLSKFSSLSKQSQIESLITKSKYN